jgi:hypothetical protein
MEQAEISQPGAAPDGGAAELADAQRNQGRRTHRHFQMPRAEVPANVLKKQASRLLIGQVREGPARRPQPPPVTAEDLEQRWNSHATSYNEATHFIAVPCFGPVPHMV